MVHPPPPLQKALTERYMFKSLHGCQMTYIVKLAMLRAAGSKEGPGFCFLHIFLRIAG